jgi:hypothetical protein
VQKLKDIKVIFVDIDKTLTDNNRQVPAKNSEVIKKAVQQGIMVVLCSGRDFSYTEEKSKEANASNYIIASNGAQIYDYLNKKTLFKIEISKESIAKLIEDFKELGIECILNTSTTRYGTKCLNREMNENEGRFEKLEDIEKEEILQVVGEVHSFELMDKMVKKIGKYHDLIIKNLSRAYVENKKNEENYYADINNYTVSKGEGIKNFLKIFNIKKEEAICFGDFINDIEMFDECGYKVAMDNASDELKEKADYITLSNEESGVGVFIEKYILNN